MVPLETAAGALPRLLVFEVMRPPNSSIALLHFTTGQLPGSVRTEETQSVAILDLGQNQVLGIVPDRLGEKRAKWTWEENRLVVESG